jgi:hypothetical protein
MENVNTASAHFLCRIVDGKPRHLRAVSFPVFESGMWDIKEDEAKALVGGMIYLHDTKAEPSYFGGVVTGYRPADGAEYEGRWVFTVASTPSGKKAAWEGKDHAMSHFSGILA